MSNEIILYPDNELRPEGLFTPTPRAAKRVLEFFTAQINNDHTTRGFVGALSDQHRYPNPVGRVCSRRFSTIVIFVRPKRDRLAHELCHLL